MRVTGDIMLIHLSKPGGQREGPYTLEQIIRDLAANKYHDTDYWAWHEGLTEWVPLYLLPGIAPNADPVSVVAEAPPPSGMPAASQADTACSDTAPAAVATIPFSAEAQPPPSGTPAATAPVSFVAPEPQVKPPDHSTTQVSTPSAAPVLEPAEEPTPTSFQVSSGMPTSALEQIFMFTTGDGPTAWHSPTVAQMLKEIIGEDPGVLRADIPRDVVARCAVGELLKADGSISNVVWRVMAGHRPAIVRDARDRLYRVCVRTFPIEAEAVVVLVLFYNKQKL